MSRNARLASVVAVARAVRLAVRPGGPSMGERAGAMPRLVRATFSGEYVGVSKGRLLLMLAAAGYLVSPLDMIPEAVLPIVGLADDALVLGWLATRLVEETEAFLDWEKGVLGTPSGPSGGTTGGSADGTGGSGGTGGAGGSAGGSSAGGYPGAGPAASGSAGFPPNGTARPAAAQVIPGDVIS